MQGILAFVAPDAAQGLYMENANSVNLLASSVIRALQTLKFQGQKQGSCATP
jgi:hypothetical protein